MANLANPSPDSWSVPVTAFSVLNLPPEKGIPNSSGGFWRPYGFIPGTDAYPWLAVVDDAGEVYALELSEVPHMAGHHEPNHPRYRESYLALLHHRKHVEERREPFVRILEIANGFYEAKLRYGEHPDHPGEEGFYIGARHIGHIALDNIAVPQYLQADAVNLKYFPLPTQPIIAP